MSEPTDKKLGLCIKAGSECQNFAKGSSVIVVITPRGKLAMKMLVKYSVILVGKKTKKLVVWFSEMISKLTRSSLPVSLERSELWRVGRD